MIRQSNLAMLRDYTRQYYRTNKPNTSVSLCFTTVEPERESYPVHALTN